MAESEGLSNLIAVCQLACRSDKDKNREDCKQLVTKAAKSGAKMVFLPEGTDYLADTIEESMKLVEPMDGPTVKYYQELASSLGVWLSIGIHSKSEDPSENHRLYNRHVIIDSSGKVVEFYDKLHLYDMAVEGMAPIKESSWTIPGEKIVPPVTSPVGNIGLAICYDLRFPELSLSLAKQGADILTYPSAFLQTTGLAHWEALLRARAIENQCYVVAAAQTGQLSSGRVMYGHSMVVDPWGQIIASCHEGQDVCLANIDLDYLKSVRKQMPVWSHRRTDVYKLSVDTKDS
ncbi:deaminated glutathione amidase-like [Apostichopus japonicus]|uniref:deaminated glutathione amidase-like n=1 Tax=Stichopus japonicus TaxID=307972 RepID=UPI003AB7D3C1